jgi:hypothetical protein
VYNFKETLINKCFIPLMMIFNGCIFMEVVIMKLFCFFTVVFLMVGISSVTAQDLLVLRDGNIIEAKVIELSPSEIKYKRFEHLDGPTIVIPANNVLSIRYENGKVETINAAPIAGQKDSQAESPETTVMDPDRFRFGINVNAGGALGYLWGGASGLGINIELGKGHFNSEINLMFPAGGFGGLVTLNYFWPSRLGGAYLGGGIGLSTFDPFASRNDSSPDSFFNIGISLPIGINAGYKFVTKSGLYFRTGGFLAFDFGSLGLFTSPIYFKPDLAIGWTMR